MATVSSLQVKIKVDAQKANSAIMKFRQNSVKSIKAIKDSVISLNKSLGSVSSKLSTLNKRVGNVAGSINSKLVKSSQNVNKLRSSFTKADGAAKKLKKSASGIAAGYTRAGAAGKRAGRQINTGMRGVVRTNSKILNQIAKVRRGFYLIRFAIKPIIAVVVGLVTAFAAVGVAVNRVAGRVKELSTWSKTLGVSTKDLEKWSFAGKSIGFEFDKVADIFKDVNDKVGDFILTGGGEAANVFKELGVSADQLRGKKPQEVLEILAKATSKLGRQQQIFAFEAIANDASKFIPLLENSGRKITEIFQRFERLDIALKPEEILNLEGFRTSASTLTKVFSSLVTKIAAALAPGLTEITEKILMTIEQAGGISQVAQNIVDSFGPVFSQIKDGALEGVNSLKTIANGFLSVGKAAAWAGQSIEEAVNNIKDMSVGKYLAQDFAEFRKAAAEGVLKREELAGRGDSNRANEARRVIKEQAGITNEAMADRVSDVKAREKTSYQDLVPKDIFSPLETSSKTLSTANNAQAIAVNSNTQAIVARTQAEIDARKKQAEYDKTFQTTLKNLQKSDFNKRLSGALERKEELKKNPYKIIDIQDVDEYIAARKQQAEDDKTIKEAKERAKTDASLAANLNFAGISLEKKITDAGVKFTEQILKGATSFSDKDLPQNSKNMPEKLGVVETGIKAYQDKLFQEQVNKFNARNSKENVTKTASILDKKESKQPQQVNVTINPDMEAFFSVFVDKIGDYMQEAARSDKQ